VDIEVSYHDTDVAIVTLHGEHDLSSKEPLRQTLRSLLRSGEQIVVDLSVVEFIDSSVLNNLVTASKLAQERRSSLTLQIGTTPVVWRVLEVSGLLNRLPCFPTRDDAIQAARNGSAHTPDSQST
jgi:anti-sigma B factor antagonist